MDRGQTQFPSSLGANRSTDIDAPAPEGVGVPSMPTCRIGGKRPACGTRLRIEPLDNPGKLLL